MLFRITLRSVMLSYKPTRCDVQVTWGRLLSTCAAAMVLILLLPPNPHHEEPVTDILKVHADFMPPGVQAATTAAASAAANTRSSLSAVTEAVTEAVTHQDPAGLSGQQEQTGLSSKQGQTGLQTGLSGAAVAELGLPGASYAGGGGDEATRASLASLSGSSSAADEPTFEAHGATWPEYLRPWVAYAVKNECLLTTGHSDILRDLDPFRARGLTRALLRQTVQTLDYVNYCRIRGGVIKCDVDDENRVPFTRDARFQACPAAPCFCLP